MYIWRKSAGALWLRARSEELTRRFGSALALVERPGSERAELEIFCRTERQAREVIRQFGGSVEKLPPGWLQHFMKRAQAKPLRIGSRLAVLSAPARTTAATRSIVIPAEAAFGTGHHATTAMCLRMLERITRPLAPDWTMFDAGTGSGILALAGSCFGAKRIVAIDLDPLACSTAKRNARANRIRNIEFIRSDVRQLKLRETFDVMTANLFSEILIEVLPVWSRRLTPGGCLILSGILRSQESGVRRALQKNGLDATEIRRRGKWIALRCL